MGISESTFCRWKKVYAGVGVAEIQQLKQLENENAKLKRALSDLTLDKAMLQDILRKNSETAVRREIVCHLQTVYDISERRACKAGRIPSLITTLQASRRSTRERGKPKSIRCDNGPEFAGKMLDQ